MRIPFNKPYFVGKELEYIKDAIDRIHISGDGYYTKKCNQWLEEQTGCSKALLTHSCTAALEMAAILANIQPGDEIIMPSYTFVSTANAFVLRGGIPVFIDIKPATMNMDERLIADAISERTKAIVPVHYAGVACEMNEILNIANEYNLYVIEDAAQGLCSNYFDKPLGSLGHLATFSFHETKNIIAGECGALAINDALFKDRAEIIREKGTDRSKFFRGEIDKYTWVDVGSSYLPSDIIAATLYAQMEMAEKITEKRINVWNMYYQNLKELENKDLISLPVIPKYCKHNAHIFYIKTKNLEDRSALMQYLSENGVKSSFHFVPLHNTKAGLIYGTFRGKDKYTSNESEKLLRLPL